MTREITAAEYKRLTYEQQQTYLLSLHEDELSDSDNESLNDNSEDEWIPPQSTTNDLSDFSDVEDVNTDPGIEIELEELSSEEVVDDNNTTAKDENFPESYLVGKDGTKWKKGPVAVTRIQKHNILRQKPGPVAATKSLSVVNVFKCVFSKEMVDIIVRETNRKADPAYQKWNAENPGKPIKPIKETFE